MNEQSHSDLGRISVHGNGMGAPTPEMVEKRAREIALINERKPDEYTDGDWDQARLELLGRAPAEDADELADHLSERDEQLGEHGHRAPRNGGYEDEESIGEQLVSDGVEEAEHDQMVEAAREDQEQEG